MIFGISLDSWLCTTTPAGSRLCVCVRENSTFHWPATRLVRIRAHRQEFAATVCGQPLVLSLLSPAVQLSFEVELKQPTWNPKACIPFVHICCENSIKINQKLYQVEVFHQRINSRAINNRFTQEFKRFPRHHRRKFLYSGCMVRRLRRGCRSSRAVVNVIVVDKRSTCEVKAHANA